ncbi:MAG: tRNA preQ1(34) S-adenosylmethionine ribosyltransferase-isomerase QueA [Nitratiruptor sp.]|nr:tRNA preQ1(34) S-adenosylmethionine ribosyltransferase-isomerase QueA [Nitratiruptor sp.]NPA83939.1 tRNA preQ1(34) S-adenosylmethionine ribosyltransferase-isomerase QueA [Campylobacterota bacterium]
MPRDPLLVSSYDYHLPPELIAKEPAEPAESARLLVYQRRTGTIRHCHIRDLPGLIPEGTTLFFNDTRVIKARLFGRKATGGKIELLLNRPLPQNRFNVFIKGRVRPGTRLLFPKGLEALVQSLHPDGSRDLSFFVDREPIDFSQLVSILEEIGHVPLPPYIDRPATALDTIRYQPVTARIPGAVAAPTASLHFTPQLLEELQRRFQTATITLHVGAGTFKPVTSQRIVEHTIHSEYYQIPLESARIIEGSSPILAIGTTTTRTIEYYWRTRKREGECDLFLHPLNPPQRVDFLLTNFHLPKSTLIMLVASFLGVETTLELYKIAVENRYRFYSYGDAMLIL